MHSLQETLPTSRYSKKTRTLCTVPRQDLRHKPRCTGKNNSQQTLVVGHHVSMLVTKKRKQTRRRPALQFASPDVQTSIQGSQAKLYCIYDGKPTPEVVWRKGNKLLMPEYDDRLSLRSKGKILMINNVTTADEGNYTCVANNSAGEAPPQSVFLDAQVNVTHTASPSSEKGECYTQKTVRVCRL
ncbi:hypothetical protein B566_EDAN014653 [Ephemera danica]|nr:hypothetical protein B566_EDAN014653 [Ephemera danica]